uniref:Large ribosomal subunit protein bL36m n=1 Tax=Schistosoma japonicum TaxID=6182 RepID=C1LKX7_SCHJA|nr:hypothetical protein [Schistosoma japonicum]CAX75356.1 hypothetical protein [Schistosoma japonicum]
MNPLRHTNSIYYTFRSLIIGFPAISQNIMALFNVQSRFYKMHNHLIRRCRDCYFDRRDGRLYVECSTHKRHKQAEKMNPPNVPWTFKRSIWKTVCW